MYESSSKYGRELVACVLVLEEILAALLLIRINFSNDKELVLEDPDTKVTSTGDGIEIEEGNPIPNLESFPC